MGNFEMSHPLLDVLANWPGRAATEVAFEARGFLIAKAWRQRMIESCGADKADELNRYWDEFALEQMRNARYVDSYRRQFSIEPRYRSAFLDELFAARKDFADPESRNPMLIKCLYEHHRKATDPDAREFRDSAIAKRRNLQKLECERFGIDATGWTGKKKDVVPFADQFCTALGFKRVRKVWQKKLDCGLVFEVSLDRGGSAYVTMQTTDFRIFYPDDQEFGIPMIGGGPFNDFVPGSSGYGAASSPEAKVLGIRASIELFDVIASSLETANSKGV